MPTETTAKQRRQHRIDHGLCPECGEEAAPYYLCPTHRLKGSVSRMMGRMADSGIVIKGKDGQQTTYSVSSGWETKFDEFACGTTLFDMDPDDKRLRPRLGRRPVDLDETLISIFVQAGRPLQMEEICAAWGKLRSKRKHATLAADMAALIAAQRKRDERNAKRARAHERLLKYEGDNHA